MKIRILIVVNIPQIPIKYANQNNNFQTFNRHESWKFLFLSAHPKVSKDCEKVLCVVAGVLVTEWPRAQDNPTSKKWTLIYLIHHENIKTIGIADCWELELELIK